MVWFHLLTIETKNVLLLIFISIFHYMIFIDQYTVYWIFFVFAVLDPAFYWNSFPLSRTCIGKSKHTSRWQLKYGTVLFSNAFHLFNILFGCKAVCRFYRRFLLYWVMWVKTLQGTILCMIHKLSFWVWVFSVSFLCL